MKNDNLWSKTIDYLRFPLMGGVVFIHFNLTDGIGFHGTTYGVNNPDWYYFIVYIISCVFASVAVPWFFLISGFLFYYNAKIDSKTYLKKIKTRVFTLLIPFVMWNLIAIIWKMKCFLPVLSSYFKPVELQFSFVRLFYTFFFNGSTNGLFVNSSVTNVTDSNLHCHPIDGPLWFVRELMLMVIISPIIAKLIYKVGFIFIIIVGFVWFFLESYIILDGYSISVITALFFFSCGAYFSINNKNLIQLLSNERLKMILLIYLIIAVFDTFSRNMEYNIYIHNIGILLGIVSVTLWASIKLRKGVKINAMLANSSFFIFAFHDIFIKEFGMGIFLTFHIPDNNPYAMLAFYFGVPLVSIAFCVLIYKFLKEKIPVLCNLLTGAR